MKTAMLCGCVASIVIPVAVGIAQNPTGAPKVVLREVRFSGSLPLPESELQDFAVAFKGKPSDESKLSKQISSAVRGDLQHRGYLLAKVKPTIVRLDHTQGASEDVALELAIDAGVQYHVGDITFSGPDLLSAAEMRQAFELKAGDIADQTKIGSGMSTLRRLFEAKGKHVAVVPQYIVRKGANLVDLDFQILAS